MSVHLCCVCNSVAHRSLPRSLSVYIVTEHYSIFTFTLLLYANVCVLKNVYVQFIQSSGHTSEKKKDILIIWSTIEC